MLEDVDAGLHGRQRVAELVRQHSDELTFAPVRFAELIDQASLGRDVVANRQDLLDFALLAGERNDRPLADHHLLALTGLELVGLTLASLQGAFGVFPERLPDHRRPDLGSVAAHNLRRRPPAEDRAHRGQRRVDVEDAKAPIVKDQVDRDVLDGVSEQGLGVSQLVHPLGARAQQRPLFEPSAALDVSPSFGGRVAQEQRQPAGLDRKSGDVEVLVESGEMGYRNGQARRHSPPRPDDRARTRGKSDWDSRCPIWSSRFVPKRRS